MTILTIVIFAMRIIMHTVFAMYIKSKIFRHCPTALAGFTLGRISDFAGFYKRAAIHFIAVSAQRPCFMRFDGFLFQNFRTTFSVAVRFKYMRKIFLLLFLSSCLRGIGEAK